MTENSTVGGHLEPIENSAIWKSVLCEAVLYKALDVDQNVTKSGTFPSKMI